MRPAIVTFTDFGAEGPYLGQVRAALLREAPTVPVIDLMADAPSFDPVASAYLLAALVAETPPGCVIMAVVDPGVGGARDPLVAEAGGRLFVGPDNGLFEPVMRRADGVRCWRIDWRPARLSATFHGRDLFAPVAGRLARGEAPEAAGCAPLAPPRRADWPDDLARVVYVDRYGNAMTGLRADGVRSLAAAGVALARADRFSAVSAGEAFWYANSIGLAEIAVNGGSAAERLGLRVGDAVSPGA